MQHSENFRGCALQVSEKGSESYLATQIQNLWEQGSHVASFLLAREQQGSYVSCYRHCVLYCRHKGLLSLCSMMDVFAKN